jgi:hypothetical protein
MSGWGELDSKVHSNRMLVASEYAGTDPNFALNRWILEKQRKFGGRLASNLWNAES